MAATWTPNDIQRMMVCSTTCICLLVFVGGSLWLVDRGIIGPTQLGLVSGTGVLGIGALLVSILRIALKG